MIPRRKMPELERLIGQVPAIVIVGPRQVGKTTLALELADERPSVYLDLESDADRARLEEPELYLADHEDELVVLDEVHRLPDLFMSLRGSIDRGRRAGRRAGRFLLLGSASIELLRQSGESLAGRVTFVELEGLDVTEVGETDQLWVRGGFPESFLADDDEASMRWRRDFIRTYLERDIPQFGPRIPAETLRRFWTMLAHAQGGILNAANLARGLGVDGKTVARYLDLLVDLLLVRRLPPWTTNTGKRMVRSPKVYVRDSGLVHALLGLPDKEAVLGHPVAGPSWEGHVVENLLACAPDGVSASYYRTAAGAEADLVLSWPGGATWLVEVKRSLAPRLTRGFHSAWADLRPQRGFVVYPGQDRYRLEEDVEVVGPAELAARLASNPPHP
jgi:predicted AAA+ superfamily ATPase